MSRIIDNMTTEEIQQHLKDRKSINKEVSFYVDKSVIFQYNRLRDELAANIPVPPPQEKPSKYVFNAKSLVKEKLCLCFSNGLPSLVSYNNVNIGRFRMTHQTSDDYRFTIESKDYAKFWELLEKHPNLFVEVEITGTSVGTNNHVKVYATTTIADFSWFY